MRRFLSFILPVVAWTLTGCAAQAPTYYYTLQPGATSLPVATSGSPAKFALSVQPVSLPEQVDRVQIVVTDPSSTQVVPLNDFLWAAPLAQEIRSVLSSSLSNRLGVPDLPVSAAVGNLPLWRVIMDIQRFESMYERHALIEATWRLEPVHQPKRRTLICRGQASIEVGTGISGLVEGHQQLLQRYVSAIAEQLRTGKPDFQVDGLVNRGCTVAR